MNLAIEFLDCYLLSHVNHIPAVGPSSAGLRVNTSGSNCVVTMKLVEPQKVLDLIHGFNYNNSSGSLSHL